MFHSIFVIIVTIEKLYQIFQTESLRVCTDSRVTQPGDLFFALRGEHFDGNRFAEEALQKGARYAVIDNAEFYRSNGKYLLVENSLTALQQLATHHRQQFTIPFIAVAGSNGKTTTKELITAVLQTIYTTYHTPGNLNNEIGTPLTLLQIKQDAEMAVVEMGARRRGDIAFLCRLVQPTHGIVTNTGKDHLETFLTVENTLHTNAELYHFLAAHEGIVFVSEKQTDLMQVSNGVKNRLVYGEQHAHYVGKIIKLFPYLEIGFTYRGSHYAVRTRLTGKYNFENIMAAVAVGLYFDVPPLLIKKALENYQPRNNRSQLIIKNDNVFILDAYNANPSSMKEALDNLELIQAEKKMVILGDMLELGDASYEEHMLVALRLKNMHLSQIVLIGDEFARVADKLDCLHFNNVEETRRWFVSQPIHNTVILLKGSRKLALEKLLQPC